jgi:hypothetical protein
MKNEAGRLVLLGTGFSKAVLGLARLVGTSLDTKRTPEFGGVSEDCRILVTLPQRISELGTRGSPVEI